MIVVQITLTSAVSRDRDTDLGTLVIDNITSQEKLKAHGGRLCDYRCRAYRKNALTVRAKGNARNMVMTAKHHREGFVRDHARHAEPVGNLIAKALKGMGYG